MLGRRRGSGKGPNGAAGQADGHLVVIPDRSPGSVQISQPILHLAFVAVPATRLADLCG
jgi:hypothetical protein